MSPIYHCSVDPFCIPFPIGICEIFEQVAIPCSPAASRTAVLSSYLPFSGSSSAIVCQIWILYSSNSDFLGFLALFVQWNHKCKTAPNIREYIHASLHQVSDRFDGTWNIFAQPSASHHFMYSVCGGSGNIAQFTLETYQCGGTETPRI